MKKIALVLLFPFFLLAESSSFEYYADGIYDAYIQINKDIQAGIGRRYMHEYKGKFIVAVDVEEASTVKIIFYKTVGVKNALNPVVVKHVGSKKSLLVFDTFERKANARALKKRLIDYGLEGVSIYNRATSTSYKRNPVVINKLIRDLKKTIKDTTVKVVRVSSNESRGSSKSLPDLQTFKSKTRKTSKKEKSACNTRVKTVDDFIKLRRRYCKVGFIIEKKLILCKKSYSIGDYVKGFKLKKIIKENGESVAVLLGDNGQFFKLRDSWCSNPKTPCESSKSTQKKKKEKEKKVVKEKEIKKKESAFAVCNFGEISVIKDANKKTRRVADTGYAGQESLKVTIYERLDKRTKVRGGGEPYIYIGNRDFKKKCKEK